MNPHARLFAMFVGIIPITSGITDNEHTIFACQRIVKMLVSNLSNLHNRAIGLR